MSWSDLCSCKQLQEATQLPYAGGPARKLERLGFTLGIVSVTLDLERMLTTLPPNIDRLEQLDMKAIRHRSQSALTNLPPSCCNL